MSEAKQGELITEDEPQTDVATVEVDRDDCGDYSLSPSVPVTQITQLSNFVRKSRDQIQKAIDANDDVTAMFLQASLVRQLEAAIDGPILTDICHLAGNRNGFRTDRDAKGEKYSPAQIKSVIVWALCSGLRCIGNEINIIEGSGHITREGFEAKVNRECVGKLDMTDFFYQVSASERKYHGKTSKGTEYGIAYCSAFATWKVDGQEARIDFNQRDGDDYRIPIKCYGSDQDAGIIGKAERVLFKRVYKLVTGSRMTMPDDDEQEETPPPITGPKPVDIGELLDQLEDGLNPKMEAAKTIKDVDDAEQKAKAWLKTVENVEDHNFAEAEEHINTLCEARREDIRAKRKS